MPATTSSRRWPGPATISELGGGRNVGKRWQKIFVLHLEAYEDSVRQANLRSLDDQLGLRIAPSQVRLQPSAEDEYAWSATESKAHLLDCSLGNGSVGLYEAICKELGRSIEAVRPETLRTPSTDPLIYSDDNNVSYHEKNKKGNQRGGRSAPI